MESPSQEKVLKADEEIIWQGDKVLIKTIINLIQS